MPTPRILRLAALVAVIGAAACGRDPTTPSDDSRIIEGVDFDLLFSEPSLSELSSVAADWAMRGSAAVDVVTERDTVVAVGLADIRVRVVSHDVGGVRHFGAVLTAMGVVGPAPVIVYAHGGDGGTTVEELLLQFIFAGPAVTQFVWAIPSFRSESLGFAGTTWTSDGPPSPWDRDVDDALALLDVALAIEPAADVDNIGVLGFSRGAGVGMLMGIRDARIDRVVEFFGPTDFFDPFIQDVIADALRGTLRGLPGLAFLNDTYVQPLRRGDVTIAQVRPELIRRSAVLFADRLPPLQLHHGTEDTVVEVSQAESMIAAMQALGRGSPDFEATLYAGGGHSLLTLPGSVPAAVDFLSALLPLAPTR